MDRAQRGQLLQAARQCWQQLGSDEALGVVACAQALADCSCSRAYAIVAHSLVRPAMPEHIPSLCMHPVSTQPPTLLTAQGTPVVDEATRETAREMLERTIRALRTALADTIPSPIVSFPAQVRASPLLYPQCPRTSLTPSGQHYGTRPPAPACYRQHTALPGVPGPASRQCICLHHRLVQRCRLLRQYEKL